MKLLFLFFIIFTSHAVVAQEWYEGSWVFDSKSTHQSNPLFSAYEIAQIQAGYDKHAGTITINKKRVKGTKKAKFGIPYQVLWQSGNQVGVKLNGAIIEIVKAVNPRLRGSQIQVKVTRINYHLIAIEVPELDTIKMYLRRVG